MFRVLAALALALSPWAHAGILRVAEGASGAGDGSGWADAFPRLQDALAVAVAGDEIWVASGVYYPDEKTGQADGTSSASFRMKPLVPLYGGFVGTEAQLSERDPERNLTILSGDIDQDDLNNDGNRIAETSADIVGTNSAAVVRYIGYVNAGEALLDGFIITAGSGGLGGGLILSSKPFTVSRCQFLGNTGSGGGAAHVTAHGVAFTHCRFSGNSARGGGGAVKVTGNVTFSHCRFDHNQAAGSGGAIESASSEENLVVDCRFESNTAAWTGGAWASGVFASEIVRCHFSGNSSLLGGGALYTRAREEVSDCSFQSNTSQADGGAWLDEGPGSAFARCKFSGNSTAGSGGAVSFRGATGPAACEVVNCLFQSNAAAEFGGAWSEGGDSQMNHCTFSGNRAYLGGAIRGGGNSFRVTNSIIWGNLATGAQLTIQNSLFSDCLFVDCILQGYGAGPDNRNLRHVDPVFLLPADPAIAPAISGNLQLAHGSPALDTGNNFHLAPTTDLVGAPRIVNLTVDLGAYEGQNNQFDADGDGLSDAFELAASTPPSRTALGAEEDGDGDGLTNLLEFAFGLDPRLADAHQAFEPLVVEADGERYLSLRYLRNAWACQFLRVDVEHSLDLGATDPWSTGETVTVGVMPRDGNVEEVTVRSLVHLGTQPADFLRIQAEENLP